MRASLRGALFDGRASLFMGAGFSSAAKDQHGQAVPLGQQLAEELFALCFPGERRDESTLQDLYHRALSRHREGLERLLRHRLTIDPASLPLWYRAWFAPPWRRAWTLNVDEVEQAAAEAFALPRPVAPISALDGARGPEHLPPAAEALAVVHLNGTLDDGCEHVTFATTQYGQRLAQHDRWYSLLAEDLARDMFVFVGTRLDESPLWQHLEGLSVRGHLEASDSPRSLLVTPRLDRARRCLLEDYGIDWVNASAEEFATEVLAGCA